ncbi:unnamed protein product, partial [Choristocarpus tenellus]
SSEATVRKQRLLFARLVVRMGDERLPEMLMFGEFAKKENRKRNQGGQEKNWLTCLKDDLDKFGIGDEEWSTTVTI